MTERKKVEEKRVLCMFLLFVLICVGSGSDQEQFNKRTPAPKWLVNLPPGWMQEQKLGNNMRDVSHDEKKMANFAGVIAVTLSETGGRTDGELPDALEHFFWGKEEGIAIELGALDGSKTLRSQTWDYEAKLGWKRILIDGNPWVSAQQYTR